MEVGSRGVARPAGLEPAASASAGQRSNPLSYGAHVGIVHRGRAGDGASVVARASVRATQGRRYVASSSSLGHKVLDLSQRRLDHCAWHPALVEVHVQCAGRVEERTQLRIISIRRQRVDRPEYSSACPLCRQPLASAAALTICAAARQPFSEACSRSPSARYARALARNSRPVASWYCVRCVTSSAYPLCALHTALATAAHHRSPRRRAVGAASPSSRNAREGVVGDARLEPAASASAGQRSNPLSYGRTPISAHRTRAGDGASSSPARQSRRPAGGATAGARPACGPTAQLR